jgi:hypothetical protein
VTKIAADYAMKLPLQMSYTLDTATAGSLHIFRGQEIDRFNKLLDVMKKSLKQLEEAIAG